MAQALINLKTTTNARNNSISLTSKYEIFNSTAEITSKKATKSNKNGKKWEQVKMEKSQRTWAAWNIKRHKRVPNCTVTNRLNCKRICHARKTVILLLFFFFWNSTALITFAAFAFALASACALISFYDLTLHLPLSGGTKRTNCRHCRPKWLKFN